MSSAIGIPLGAWAGNLTGTGQIVSAQDGGSASSTRSPVNEDFHPKRRAAINQGHTRGGVRYPTGPRARLGGIQLSDHLHLPGQTIGTRASQSGSKLGEQAL